MSEDLPLAATTRRGFLRLAGSTAAFTALAQLRAVPAAAAERAAQDGTTFFDDAETEILTQLTQRMVESGEASAPRVRDTHTIATIDALCASLDPAITGPLPWALRLFEYGPFLFDLRLSRFTHLAPDAQDAALEGWMRSRFALRRQAFYALRNLAFLGYYSQEEVWPLVGYRGPLLRRGTGPA